ncbi:MAG: FecR family protein [Planctomycetota bacterium]
MSHDGHSPCSMPPVDDELFMLIGRLCDGVATHEDCARLDQHLAADAAVECYCAVLELEASLQWWWQAAPAEHSFPTLEEIVATAAPVPQPMPAAPPRHTAWRRVRDWLAAAASVAGRVEIEPRRLSATLLLAGLALGLVAAVNAGWGGWLPWMAVARVKESPRPADALAAIRAVDRVEWREATAGRAASKWLPGGARLDLVRGLVEISYLTGATVILEGPASFEISGPGTGRLDRGRLTATLHKPRASFAIQTPTAVVTDRGTQFGVEVNERGATDVRVFQGLVELAAAGLADGSPVLQLAAGQAGEVDTDGHTTLVAAPAPKKFVTSVAVAGSRRRDPRPYAWDDSAAVTLLEDAFIVAGSARQAGALHGTTPSGRGGAASWIAPSAGWQVDPVAGGLAVTAAGAAFLPFRPEPGFVYRLSVELHVQSGGSGWAAVGFAERPTVEAPTLDHAWMLQRHSTTLQSHRSARTPNAAFAGPGEQGRLPSGDVLTGPQVRSVVLDTTGPQWRAFFLVGDTLIGDCRIDDRGRSIRYVGLSVFADTTATFRNFSLESFRPLSP